MPSGCNAEKMATATAREYIALNGAVCGSVAARWYRLGAGVAIDDGTARSSLTTAPSRARFTINEHRPQPPTC